MTFANRLKESCAKAKPPIEWKPTALGTAFGVAKQTADRWMVESLPSAEKLFEIADKLGVDPRWLATGHREEVEHNGLRPHELDLLARFRSADPRWQLALRLLSALATEDQIEFAHDVNFIIARIAGKKPSEIRYTANERVAETYGTAPHVAARRQPLVSDNGNKSQRQDAKESRRNQR